MLATTFLGSIPFVVVHLHPEEVALDGGQSPSRGCDRIGNGPQVAGDDREVRRLDRHVGSGLHVAVMSQAGGSARNWNCQIAQPDPVAHAVDLR